MFYQQSAGFYKTHWAFTYITHKALKIGLYIYVTFARKCKNRALMLSIVAYLTSSLSSKRTEYKHTRLYRDRELCRGLSFNHLLNPLFHGICEFQGWIQRYLNARLHIRNTNHLVTNVAIDKTLELIVRGVHCHSNCQPQLRETLEMT